MKKRSVTLSSGRKLVSGEDNRLVDLIIATTTTTPRSTHEAQNKKRRSRKCKLIKRGSTLDSLGMCSEWLQLKTS